MVRGVRRVSFVLSLSVTLVFLLALFSSPVAGAAPSQDATQGKALFDKNCASCHGASAAGGIKIGSATSADIRWSRIGPAGKNYRGDESLIKRAILTGKDEKGEDLDPVMPRWQGKLTDAQVNDIIAFLKTTGAAVVTATSAPKQATPAVLPKTGSPIGTQSMAWIAGFAALLVVTGLGIRRWVHIS